MLKQHVQKEQLRHVLEIGCSFNVGKNLKIYLLMSSFFSEATGLRFATLLQIEYLYNCFS